MTSTIKAIHDKIHNLPKNTKQDKLVVEVLADLLEEIRLLWEAKQEAPLAE